MKKITFGKGTHEEYWNDLPAPIFYCDLEWVYIDCNASFERLTGKKREEITGHNVREVFPAGIASVFEDQLQEVCKATGTNSFEIMIQFPEGNKSYYLIKYSAIEDGNMKLCGVAGVVTDISPIKVQALETHQYHVERCHKKQGALLSESESLQMELHENQRELASHLSLLIRNEKKLELLHTGLESLQPFLNETGKEMYKTILKDKLLDSFSENWIDFERKFDDIHYSFYIKLEDICSGITRSEKKLCAYLKMNLTSSDISALEKKTLNSINVAFSRLREKFQVSSNEEIKARMIDL